jgi:hypothetical protein
MSRIFRDVLGKNNLNFYYPLQIKSKLYLKEVIKRFTIQKGFEEDKHKTESCLNNFVIFALAC